MDNTEALGNTRHRTKTNKAKNTTQKTKKMSNTTDPTKNRGWTVKLCSVTVQFSVKKKAYTTIFVFIPPAMKL